jgi:hypothetical protein
MPGIREADASQRRLWLLAAASATALFLPFAPALGHDVPLWATLPRACTPDPLSAQAKRCQVVRIDPGALANAGLVLTLPDGTSVVARKDGDEDFEGRGFVWHGTVAGASFSNVTFSLVRDTVIGTIALGGRMYRLRVDAGGSQVVEMLSFDSLPRGAEPIEHQPPPPPLPPNPPTPPAPAGCTTEDPHRVDVMVVFTAAARAAAGGPDAIAAWIFLQVYETNRSYLESNADIRVRLVHQAEIAYSESDNTTTSLNHLTRKSDGKLDGVHQWRDDFNADAVVLVTYVPGTSISGLANAMRDYHIPDANFASFEPLAFAVVDAGGFETPEFTLAHELGHLLGAQHNRDASDSVTAGAIPASSYGFLDDTPGAGCNGWMTVMAIREGASSNDPGKCPTCDRLARWSTDDTALSNCGEPVGSATARNRDTLDFTAPVASAFRCAPSAVRNVWLKDTWADTGAEPDPAQASAEMWKSPYIWVRRARDEGPQYLEQHHHQDAVRGRENYIYAKLHNGGAATSGELVFYWANASTNLSWPTSFEEAARVPVSGFENGEERIVEGRWTPHDAGHHCFVARWESAADPMSTPALASLDAYARGNNNVVWRNMNVVELWPQTQSATAALLVENPADAHVTTSILIRPADRNSRNSFFKLGGMAIKLDEAFLEAWRRSDLRGSGFNIDRGVLRVTSEGGARLEGIELKPHARIRLGLTFERPRNPGARGKFLVDVVQQREDGRESRTLGGVTYEIHVIGD